MVEASDSGQQEQVIPPLPARLVDPVPIVIGGTAVWFVGFVILLVGALVSGGPPAPWLWVCLAGWSLGLIGLAIISWQRSARRRGSRTAQQTD